MPGLQAVLKQTFSPLLLSWLTANHCRSFGTSSQRLRIPGCDPRASHAPKYCQDLCISPHFSKDICRLACQWVCSLQNTYSSATTPAVVPFNLPKMVRAASWKWVTNTFRSRRRQTRADFHRSPQTDSSRFLPAGSTGLTMAKTPYCWLLVCTCEI